MEDLDYLIGLRIKALLAIRKTNIQDLSDEFNVSYSTFRSYLNGRRKIPSDIILKLSNKFNCSTDYFYTGDMTLLTKEADMASLNAIVIRADSISDPEKRKQYYRDAINVLVSRI